MQHPEKSILKWIGIVATLAACGTDDDVTQVSGGNPPAGGTGNGLPGTSAPGVVPRSGLAPASSASKFAWAAPAVVVTPSAAGQPLSVEQAARAQLASAASIHADSARQLAELELQNVHDTGAGAIIVRFERRVEGLEVFAQGISVALDQNLRPLASSGDVRGELPTVLKAKGGPLASQFTLSPEQAVVSAIADLTGIALDAADLDEAEEAPGGYREIPLGPEALAKLAADAGTSAARTKPVLFPAAGNELVPAYYVETDVGANTANRPRYFSHVVSASDGNVLWQRDLSSADVYSYRVYADATGLFAPWDGPQGPSPTPHPSAQPDLFDPPFVAPNLVSLSSLESVGVTDPWLAPDMSLTIGNNTYALLDLIPPFSPASVTEPGVFGASFDPTLDAAAGAEQQNATVTQLFYDVNWFHDWYYAAGFTEAAGNAQLSNYDRGGLEADPLLALAQDSSDVNNAYTTTPADGAPPRIRMYLFDHVSSSLTVSTPEALAGTYPGGRFVLRNPAPLDATGPIVRAEPADACSPLVGTYTGSLVLVEAGGAACGRQAFATQVTNVQRAGAAGVIVAPLSAPTHPADVPGALGTAEEPLQIPFLLLSLADGERLRAALAQGDSVEGSLHQGNTRRAGALDNQVVAHEWGHYISNRLIHDARGLDNEMGDSLGEGWADFHSLLLIVRPEDAQNPTNLNWDGVYARSAYAYSGLRADPAYFGNRRYPYSTDLTKNPLTFQHLSDQAGLPAGIPRSFDGDHTEVHNAGEVWANMLWECYASLLRDTLAPLPRLTFDEARTRMRDYLVASYTLVPTSPTLLEARDALLAVAAARDSVDLEHFSRAFAKRGAGVFAVAPDRWDSTNAGIVESYAAGAALQVTAASLRDDVQAVCSPDGILDDGETGTLHVTVKNVGNVPSEAARAQVSSSTPGVTLLDAASISIPPLPVFGTAELGLRVSVSGLSGVTPVEFSIQLPDAGAGSPPPASYAFRMNVDELPGQSFSDGAESSHVVWTVTTDSDNVAESRLWQLTTASATEHYYRGPSAPFAASVELQSPPLDVLPGAELAISFKHRFLFAQDASTGRFLGAGMIELSSDGGDTWSDVGASAGYTGALAADLPPVIANRPGFVGTSAGYPAFNEAALNLGGAFGGQSVLLRFRVASGGPAVTAGWDIDDISISGIATPPFDAIVPQPETCR